MLITRRSSTSARVQAVGVVFCLIAELVLPGVALALTGGPSQPEVTNFEPIGTSEMVDLFTGDFVYNIPLLDVGGYPINLSYHSGISMDQEASWVGLGWNVNAGVINRGIRGLPDDFNGVDQVRKEFNLKDNETYGAKLDLGNIEFFGKPIGNGKKKGPQKLKKLDLGIGLGIFHNNYRGLGLEFSIDPALSVINKNKFEGTIGLGLSASSQEGLDLNPSIGMGYEAKKHDGHETALNLKIGASVSSRRGLKSLAFGLTAQGKRTYTPESPGSSRVDKFSKNGGVAIPMSLESYVPQIQLPMENISGTVHVGGVGEIKWATYKAKFTGYYSEQRLRTQRQSRPAYGYLYLDHLDRGQQRCPWQIVDSVTSRVCSIGLLDFNREKDGAFTESTPGLPLTNLTYDSYSVQGQGIGGMYRPFRGDVGTVFDSYVYNTSVSGRLGLDLGGGDVVKGGANGGATFNLSASGPWTGGDDGVRGALSFKSRGEASPNGSVLHEPFYFKQAGEMVAVDRGFHDDKLLGDDPIRLRVDKQGEAHATLVRSSFEPLVEDPYSVNTGTMDAAMVKSERERRNQAVTVLTAEQAAEAGLSRFIESYEYLDQDAGISEVTEIPRVNDYAKPHHLSEITALRPDGSRYVFGIPAYNLRQKDVTFNVGPKVDEPEPALAKDCATGLVTYGSGDNSTGNERGVDHYFSSTTLPPFAHSYLLTAVLSPDYVDRLGDGPSDDDLGSYTRINYTRVHGAEPDAMGRPRGYRWRVPFEENTANYNEGLKTDDLDDKGSYVYGVKEVWYPHSIETKTHIAEFTLSGRDDSYGVASENGGLDTDMALKKLKRIDLYAKWDRRTHGDDAVPIKSVHFKYGYSLAQGVPNNINTTPANPTGPDTGKLRLEEVHFTYGESRKGRLSPYRFHYSDVNPDYDLKGYDRWGNYKENRADASCDPSVGKLNNADFPYVEQDQTRADANASAWSLERIDLPSGGVIRVDYESDDYAYVQDRRAMQMVTVDAVGTGETAFEEGNPGRLFEGSDNRLYLRLKLPEKLKSGEDFARRYLMDAGGNPMRELYFKFLVDITGDKKWEFVTGYADLEPGSWGVIDQDHAWIRLKAVPLKDQGGPDVHPIAKTAWQMARLHLSRLLNPGSEPKNQDEGALKGLLSAFGDVWEMARGYNRVLRNRGFGKEITLGKSFVRLYRPGLQKFGGGSRVRKVSINDSWRTMLIQGAGDPQELADSQRYVDFDYGQEYFYTTQLDSDKPESPIISSGVAVNEPMLGGEASPLRQAVAFTEEHKLAPDNRFYQEKPYGEVFFPGPSVGYSRVAVRNLKRDEVKRNATGFVVHEFYTARDFPVFPRQTDLDVNPAKPRWLLRLLKLDVRDYMTVSQGYTVELNNMHGVQKAQWVYPEPEGDPFTGAAPDQGPEQKPISGVEYFYRTDAVDDHEKKLAAELKPFEAELKPKFQSAEHLSNKVVVVDKRGVLRVVDVGKEIDAVADMRESSSFSVGLELGVNLDASLFPFPPGPVPIPSMWITPSREETRFRSAVLTKVVTRYGILDRVVAHDLGSRVSTENLVYDAETGEVLLTRTQNDFEDPVYSFTYPAHWGYDRMGMAARTAGLVLGGLEIGSGGSVEVGSQHSEHFLAGDQILILAAGDDPRPAWVSEVDRVSHRLTLMRRRESDPLLWQPVDPVTGAALTIFRSARKNQQATPIGTVTTLENPITADKKLAFDQVLNAGAVEFAERWDGFCECGIDSIGEERNPWLEGVLGNWRAKRSFLYLTGRSQSDLNRNTDIRRDGVFTDFRPFWAPNGGLDWSRNDGRPWQFTSEVTLFSPFGFELENRDALERYSAALYGFNNTLPTAVAANTRYREIAFESFEDLECDACDSDHLSYTTRVSDLDSDQSHTGRTSLRIAPRSSFSVVRKLACEPSEVPPLTFEADGAIEVGCDRFSGYAAEALLRAAGGIAPYTYFYDGPAGTQPRLPHTTAVPEILVRGIAAGTYTFGVTDAAGTTRTVSTRVLPNVTVRVVGVVQPSCAACADGSLTAVVEGENPPFTYRWSDPDQQTTPTATGLLPGTYLVTVTNTAGCWGQATIELGSSSSEISFDALSGLEAECDRSGGFNGWAVFCVAGGVAPYEISRCPPGGEECHLWPVTDVPPERDRCPAPLSSLGMAVGLPTGPHIFQVEDGARNFGQVTVEIEPNVTVRVVERLLPSCVDCSDGEITVVAEGGNPPFTYRWTDEEGGTVSQEATATGLGFGTYHVVVTDHGGCRESLDVVLESPVLFQGDLKDEQ